MAHLGGGGGGGRSMPTSVGILVNFLCMHRVEKYCMHVHMLFLCTNVVRTCYREIFHSEFLHIIVNESVFPTQRYCNRVPGGLDDLLSSVLLYTHVLYEGKMLGYIEYCYSAVLHYWQKIFQHHNDYSALFKICC